MRLEKNRVEREGWRSSSFSQGSMRSGREGKERSCSVSSEDRRGRRSRGGCRLPNVETMCAKRSENSGSSSGSGEARKV